jgi:hypothetical protein
METPPSGHDASQVPTGPPGPFVTQHERPPVHGVVMHAGIMTPASPPLLVDPLLLPEPLLLPLPLLLLLPLPLPLLLLPLLPVLPPSPPSFELVEPPQAAARASAVPKHTPRRCLPFFINEPPAGAKKRARGRYRSRTRSRVSRSSPVRTAFFHPNLDRSASG